MHVGKNGTLYDVYVKNDYFYKKSQESKVENSTDPSLDEYISKVQSSVPELKGLSSAVAVSVHILPESSLNKSSGSSNDVSDDILGVVSYKHHLEADENALTDTNVSISGEYDKSSIKSLLDKLRFVYKGDEYLSGALDKYSNSRWKSEDMGNGYEKLTRDISSDPFGGEVAVLNEMLSSDDSAANTKDPIAMMLQRFLESLKQEGEKALLGSSLATQDKGLAYALNESNKDKR